MPSHNGIKGGEISKSQQANREEKSTPRGTEVGEETSEGRARAEPALPRMTSVQQLSSLLGAARRGRHTLERGVSAKTNLLKLGDTHDLKGGKQREAPLFPRSTSLQFLD